MPPLSFLSSPAEGFIIHLLELLNLMAKYLFYHFHIFVTSIFVFNISFT